MMPSRLTPTARTRFRRARLAVVLPLALGAGYWWYTTEPTGSAGRDISIAVLVVALAVGASVVHYLRDD